jgi:membrane protease YdiL (CAAX protease family)
MKQNATARYLILAFAIGWLFQCLAIKFGAQGAGRGWLIPAMWAPLLATLFIQQARSSVWAAFKRVRISYWAVALAAGWSFAILQQLLLWTTNGGQWNAANFPLNADRSGIAGVKHLAMTLGFGSQSFPWFAVNLLVSISVGSLILTFAAVGEEAGWRGFLQGKLVERLGWMKATLLVGIIWGLWHLPINLAGYNDPQHPILQTLIIFQIHTISMSFVLALLMRNTRSIWVVALAHAANNTIQSGPLLLPSNWFADQLTAVLASILVGAAAGTLLYLQTARDSSLPLTGEVTSDAGLQPLPHPQPAS